MKIFLSLLNVLIVFSCLFSCTSTKNKYCQDGELNQGDTICIDESGSNLGNPKFEKNSWVVRFPSHWNEAQRDSARNANPIVREEDPTTCPCGIGDLEIWNFDPDNFSETEIEGAKSPLSDNSERTNMEGDPNFTFEVDTVPEDFFQTRPNLSKMVGLVKDQGSGAGKQINIAVIDTGIDYFRNAESDSFLYPTRDLFSCEQFSGYNFVADVDDPSGGQNIQDDQGHGTYVTKTITSMLDNKGVNYRILPLKVFDSKGRGSYFNLLCAFEYIKKVQSERGDIHLVNASFGHTVDNTMKNSPYNLDNGPRLLKKAIGELGESLLVVTSAGNRRKNTDDSKFNHYPSGFDLDNIIGVGGYMENNAGTMEFEGNYGVQSIDVAALYGPYEYKFVDFSGEPQHVKEFGTSYGTAHTTALLAELIASDTSVGGLININPINVKNTFLNIANPWVDHNPNLSGFIKDGKFNTK